MAPAHVRPLHVAIVGSRLGLPGFPTSSWAVVLASVRSMVERYVAALPPATVVISGGATGIDSFAYEAAWAGYARGTLGRPIVCQIPLPRRHATGVEVRLTRGEFSRLAKSRNQRIVNLLTGPDDYLVAVWDGASRGTYDTIERARKAGKLREVVAIDTAQIVQGLAITEESCATTISACPGSNTELS